MAKRRNKSKSLIESEPHTLDVVEVVDMAKVVAESSSDASTTITDVVANDEVKKPKKEVPAYVQVVADAVISPMLPPDPMTCTAQELADWKQAMMGGTN